MNITYAIVFFVAITFVGLAGVWGKLTANKPKKIRTRTTENLYDWWDHEPQYSLDWTAEDIFFFLYGVFALIILCVSLSIAGSLFYDRYKRNQYIENNHCYVQSHKETGKAISCGKHCAKIEEDFVYQCDHSTFHEFR